MSISYLLTAEQKRQATLLYHFTSLTYLKELQKKIKSFRNFVEGTLQQSQRESRDIYLRDARWGERNTSENWSNNGWAYLADFDLSVLRQIADRPAEIYQVTGASFCGRAMAEYSLSWTTPDEQKEFEFRFSEILNHSNYIDMTVNKTGVASAWDDFEFTVTWENYSELFPLSPKFRVRTDIHAETGQLPSHTGVYVPIDDQNASLQFAWRGDNNGRLLNCTTFNELGKSALLEVGRERLWKDGKAMQAFVSQRPSHPAFLDDPFFDGSPSEESAPSLVAGNAFTSRPCKWYYVELVEGEFEPFEMGTPDITSQVRSFQAGTLSDKSGYYFTPAKSDSRRYFAIGQKFPEVGTSYGKTIWQWDEKQE